MKDLSPARHILGLRISQNRDRRQLFLSQTDYIGRVLERFNMQTAKSASTPLLINLWLSRRDNLTFGPGGRHEIGTVCIGSHLLDVCDGREMT